MAAARIEDGWFSEAEVMWPGQRFSLEVAKKQNGELSVLYQGKSELQDILVFDSTEYGRVLVLDGVIQLTERDEFSYQEMIAHLPMFAHPDPKRVLIVGGGDGGVLREVSRHDSVEEIDMCEIDQEVVRVAKEFFGQSTATAYNDPRLNLIHEDAAVFLQQDSSRKYDVVIVDSSDPVGPASTLFEPQFFESMAQALKPGGIICTQVPKSKWFMPWLAQHESRSCGKIFAQAEYAYTSVPTYPSGQIGFMICSNDSTCSVKAPQRVPTSELQDQLRYYSPEIHRASFVLPRFATKAIEQAKKEE